MKGEDPPERLLRFLSMTQTATKALLATRDIIASLPSTIEKVLYSSGNAINDTR